MKAEPELLVYPLVCIDGRRTPDAHCRSHADGPASRQWTKCRAYARAGIADHWIANLVARVPESTGSREAGTGPYRANWLALRARPI
jgi:hypothetical protein